MLIGTIYDLTIIALQKSRLNSGLMSPIIIVQNETEDTINTIENEESQNLIVQNMFKEDSMISKYLIGFSIYTNTKKLFKIAKNNDDDLSCLHAIRFLSIAWYSLLFLAKL